MRKSIKYWNKTRVKEITYSSIKRENIISTHENQMASKIQPRSEKDSIADKEDLVTQPSFRTVQAKKN